MPSQGNRRRRPRERFAHGLTLVEVLAVVVILGLIAATLVVSFSGTFGRARHELARTGIGVIAQKLETYRIEKGNYPGNDVGLKALTDGQATPSAAYYVPADNLLDPWSKPYVYVAPGPGGLPFEVLSYGADGQPGGSDENEDISSAKLRKKDS